MSYAVRKRKRGTPGAAKDNPGRYPKVLPQHLNVVNKALGGVLQQAPGGCGRAAAALVHQHDVVHLWIEEAPAQ